MQFKTPVEAITELSKITRQMSCADGMIGTVKSVLHIADDGVEPLKDLPLIILGSIMRENRLMLSRCLGNTGKTVQTIGNDMTSRMDIFSTPCGDLCFGETTELAQFEEQRMSLGGERKSSNKRFLAGGATAPFAVSLFPTPVGVIDEKQSFQSHAIIPILHDLLQFVFDPQGGIGGNSNGSCQVQR